MWRAVQVMLVGEQMHEDLRLESIADRTDGYSGSDLRHLCTAAAMRPLRELLTSSGKSASDQPKAKQASRQSLALSGKCPWSALKGCHPATACALGV